MLARSTHSTTRATQKTVCAKQKKGATHKQVSAMHITHRSMIDVPGDECDEQADKRDTQVGTHYAQADECDKQIDAQVQSRHARNDA